MEALKTLPFRRHTQLLTRLPETRFATQWDKSKANWIVYAEYLAPGHFEDIDFFTGGYNRLLILGKWATTKWRLWQEN